GGLVVSKASSRLVSSTSSSRDFSVCKISGSLVPTENSDRRARQHDPHDLARRQRRGMFGMQCHLSEAKGDYISRTLIDAIQDLRFPCLRHVAMDGGIADCDLLRADGDQDLLPGTDAGGRRATQ